MPRNRRSSADIADDDRTRLWRTYPALKPECSVENALHGMNGKGPIFGARMGIGICKLIVCVDDLSFFGGNRARGCSDLASALSGCHRVEDRQRLDPLRRSWLYE